MHGQLSQLPESITRMLGTTRRGDMMFPEDSPHIFLNPESCCLFQEFVGIQSSDTTSCGSILTHKFVRGGVRERRTRRPVNDAVSKDDFIALTKIVEAHIGNQPFKITAGILHSTRLASTGLAQLDDTVIRRLLLRCKRRLDSRRSNADARANKLALTVPDMDQVLRFLGCLRDDHARLAEPPNAEKDWRAIVENNLTRLPVGFAALPRACTTLSQMYSELLKGKNKNHAIRAALTAEQLELAFAALAAAAPSATGRAIPANLAAIALPTLPADVQARLAATAGTALAGAVILTREWLSRPKGAAAARIQQEGVAAEVEWEAAETSSKAGEAEERSVVLMTPAAARTGPSPSAPSPAVAVHPAGSAAQSSSVVAVKREWGEGRCSGGVLGGVSCDPAAAPMKREAKRRRVGDGGAGDPGRACTRAQEEAFFAAGDALVRFECMHIRFQLQVRGFFPQILHACAHTNFFVRWCRFFRSRVPPSPPPNRHRCPA